MLKRVVRTLAVLLCLFLGWWVFKRLTDSGAMRAALSQTAYTALDVVSAEEDYHRLTGRFTSDVRDLPHTGQFPNTYVTIRILEASDSLLRVEGSHEIAAPDASCIATKRSGQDAVVRCERWRNWLGLPRWR